MAKFGATAEKINVEFLAIGVAFLRSNLMVMMFGKNFFDYAIALGTDL